MLAARDRAGPTGADALFPLPVAPDPLLTGLAFLLLARLVLERSAQASRLPLLPRHGGRFLLAPPGIVQGLAQRSPLRRPPRPAVGGGVRARPCEPPPPPAVAPDSSATISIAPSSTSFLSEG